jgi:hypothetical protein
MAKTFRGSKMEKYQKAINKTKKTLKMYGVTFKEYMKDSGRRDDIDLGETVALKCDSNGIIVGWNSSSNYDVFIFAEDKIYNVHPNDVKKIGA